MIPFPREKKQNGAVISRGQKKKKKVLRQRNLIKKRLYKALSGTQIIIIDETFFETHNHQVDSLLKYIK